MSPTTFFEIVEDALEKLARFDPKRYRLTKRKITKLLKIKKAK